MDESNIPPDANQQEKNVVSLKAKRDRKKLEDKGSSGKRNKKLEVQRGVIEGLRNGYSGECLDNFNTDLVVVKNNGGLHDLYICDKNKQLTMYRQETFFDDLTKYAHSLKSLGDHYEIDLDMGKKIAKTFIALQPKVNYSDIAHFKELHEDGYCFQKLKYSFTEGNYDTIKGVMNRTVGADALMAYIGALFCKDRPRIQQVPWWCGDGGNGKGTLTNILAEVFGNACHFEQDPAKSFADTHFTEALIGKGLFIISECETPSIIGNGLLKALTGHDPITVNPKGRARYTAPMNIQVFITSNHQPATDGSYSQVRRLIYCKTENPPDWDTKKPSEEEKRQFELGFKKEFPHFIHECRRMYESMGKPIFIEPGPDSLKLVEGIAEDENADVDNFINTWFIIDQDADWSVCCTPMQFSERMQNDGIASRGYKKRKILNYLRTRYKINTNFAGPGHRVYKGLVPRIVPKKLIVESSYTF